MLKRRNILQRKRQTITTTFSIWQNNYNYVLCGDSYNYHNYYNYYSDISPNSVPGVLTLNQFIICWSSSISKLSSGSESSKSVRETIPESTIPLTTTFFLFLYLWNIIYQQENNNNNPNITHNQTKPSVCDWSLSSVSNRSPVPFVSSSSIPVEVTLFVVVIVIFGVNISDIVSIKIHLLLTLFL